jgi:hypothetical protein
MTILQKRSAKTLVFLSDAGRNGRPSSALSKPDSSKGFRSITVAPSLAQMEIDPSPSFEIMRSNPTMKRKTGNRVEEFDCMDSVDGTEHRHF